MNDKRTGCTPARIATTVAISLLAAGPGSSAPALARGAIVNLKQELASTGADSDARGKLRFVLKTATEARLVVQAGRLSPEASFDVLADGVKVGTISTTGGGGGKLRLRSVPRAQDEILGFDPRGTSIVVRDEDGDDVLAAMVADDTIEPGKVACCIPDDSGSECEDRTADECVAQGGTVTSSTTCLPNPCDGATTPGRDVVCCIPDDSGPECEDRTPAQCAAQGGIDMGAGSCTPNPCAASTPASGADDSGGGQRHGGGSGGHHGGDDAGGDNHSGAVGGTYYGVSTAALRSVARPSTTRGADDPAGDDRGDRGHGADNPAGDDRGGRAHGADDPAGDDRGRRGR